MRSHGGADNHQYGIIIGFLNAVGFFNGFFQEVMNIPIDTIWMHRVSLKSNGITKGLHDEFPET
ncbi:MAG: hypothetical protein IPH84_16085 [Bacteroidales bacterium]|nr:hypothetical protein [Bacteroidales bacterium]